MSGRMTKRRLAELNAGNAICGGLTQTETQELVSAVAAAEIQVEALEARVAVMGEALESILDDMSSLNDGCGCCSSNSGSSFDSFKAGRALLEKEPAP